MADEKRGEHQKDTLIEELKKASDKGMEKTIESVLNMKPVQDLLVKTVMRQSIKMGIVLAFLFYGVYSVANGVKVWLSTFLIPADLIWNVDVLVGVALILVISAYLLRQYH